MLQVMVMKAVAPPVVVMVSQAMEKVKIPAVAGPLETMMTVLVVKIQQTCHIRHKK